MDVTTWIRRNPKKSLVISLALFFIGLDFTLEKIYFPVDLNTRSARIHHVFYHHGLKENCHSEGWWGHVYYIIETNSLGFKDRRVRDVPLRTAGRRIVFMGDSFTEGLGIPEDKTFVGLVEDLFGGRGYDILNAGVVSSSPIVYYNKTKYYVEKKGLQINDLFVFLDISDVHDEYIYQEKEHFVSREEEGLSERVIDAVDQFLVDNSLLSPSRFIPGPIWWIGGTRNPSR
ncbi:MAG: hypothetical protein OEW15_01895 [Nitrospirota bacterium]|nr:hypothetical protein [Nitrospirota bacterium]